MAAIEFPEEIKRLSATMDSIEAVLDLPKMRAELADLEEQAAAPDLWDDQEKAQKVTSRLSLRAGRHQPGRRACAAALDDLEVMVELAEEEDDADTLAEAETELASHRARRSASSRSAPCSPASTTPARRSSRSAPRPVASTPPTSPRC